MLTRELRRLLLFVGPVLVLIFFVVGLYDKALIPLPSFKNPSSIDSSTESKTPETPGKQTGHPIAGYVEGRYHEIFSVSTKDKKFFPIKFDPKQSINPNAIPHPFLDDTWIIVSQLQRSSIKTTVWYAELVCNAVFKNGALACTEPPMLLPISKTPVGRFLTLMEDQN